MDTWPILLSPCICLGVADGNLDWKRRKLISFYVGSVGTNRGAEATGEVWQNTRNKVGELKTQKDIFKTHFRPQLTSSFCFMLHPSHRLTTVMRGVQVPRTCPCEQGAKRALSTIGMGCICTYANVCRWSNRPEGKGPFVIFTSFLHPYMCWGYCMKPDNPPLVTVVLPQCQRHPVSLGQWTSALPSTSSTMHPGNSNSADLFLKQAG